MNAKKKKKKKKNSVYSNRRAGRVSGAGKVLKAGSKLRLDQRQKCEGLKGLAQIGSGSIPAAFFDPQYRGVMDKMAYGNEGARQKGRAALGQMTQSTIQSFLKELSRVLTPSGHLFLWVDKFHLCEGIQPWVSRLPLEVVDLITWEKGKIGMGYRTRRKSEYLVVLQKEPRRAKGVWTRHDIPDVWFEKISGRKGHPHAKPVGLQQALIESVTAKGEVVLDPAAGSFSVLEACEACGRKFLGFDLGG